MRVPALLSSVLTLSRVNTACDWTLPRLSDSLGTPRPGSCSPRPGSENWRANWGGAGRTDHSGNAPRTSLRTTLFGMYQGVGTCASRDESGNPNAALIAFTSGQ